MNRRDFAGMVAGVGAALLLVRGTASQHAAHPLPPTPPAPDGRF